MDLNILSSAITGPVKTTTGSAADGDLLTTLAEMLERLPLAHMDDACADLLGVLERIRLGALAQKRRQEALRIIEPACIGLAERLEKAIREVGLPLPPKVVSRADQHLEICTRLIKEYERLLAETPPPSRKLIALPGAAQWTKTVLQLLLWAERALTLRQRLHLPAPPSLWLLLHGLFLQARSLGLETKAVKTGGAALEVETIYKRILLRGAFPIAALSQEQAELLDAALADWCVGLTLAPYTAEIDPADAPLYVDPQLDDGPRAYNQGGDGVGKDCLVLNSKALYRKLCDADAPDALGLASSTVALLRDALTFRSDRLAPRREVDEPARALFGIPAICHMLEEAKARKAAARGDSGPVDEEICYGDSDRFKPGSFAAPHSHYDFINVLVCDISQTGVKLEVLTQPGLQLRIGDILGIQRRESRSLSAARIRWIRAEHGQALSVGASFVAHRLRPATLISKPRGGEISRAPCFLGRHTEGDETVVGLMPIPGIGQRKLAVDRNGHKTRISLNSPPVDGSAAFEVYQFRKKKSRSRRTENLALPPDLDLDLNLNLGEDGSSLSELNVESVDNLSGLSAFVDEG